MIRRLLALIFIFISFQAVALPPVPAPLTGTVTTQTWTSFDQSFAGITLASGKPFHFNVLPPAQYSGTTYKYPLYIWLHPQAEGNAWYNGSNTNALYATGSGYEAQNYNAVPFLTAYPAFIAVPYADQTTDTSGGAVENWGGWCNSGVTGSGTVYSGDTGPNTFAVLAMINYLETQYSIDTTRIYINGFSLGGIGAEYFMQHYNAYTGDLGRVFAAGASEAGVLQINGCGGSTVTTAQSTQMKTVPVWWFSGTNDTNSLASEWNNPMWTALAGNSSYPSAITSASSNQAGTSAMRYTLCATCGHQDTDSSGNPVWTNTTINSFLFSQASSAGYFSVSSGSVKTPGGATFVGNGVGFGDGQIGAITSASQVTNLFPGTKIVEVYAFSYAAPSTYSAFVNTMTQAGIVVLFGNGQNFFTDGTSAGNVGGGCGDIFTGSILTTESNWYASMAAYYINNPYVWFTTNNEPSFVTGTTSDSCSTQGGTISLPGLATWEQATYNAIRGTGNNTIVMLEEPSGGDPGTVGAYTQTAYQTYGLPMTPSVFSTMKGVVWNLHYYGFASGYSTTQATVNDFLLGSAYDSPSCCSSPTQYQATGILAAQTIPSADGVMPVFIGEYGNSTNGTTIDANGQNVVTAVGTYANGSNAFGSIAWVWNSSYTCCDSLTVNGTSVMSPYGTSVASLIAAPTIGGETITVGTIAQQKSNMSFTVGGTISGVTTIPTLQYSVNGGAWTALPNGSPVTTSSFMFTVPGQATSTANTVAVRDANNTGIATTSNSFAVVTSSSGPSGINSVTNLIKYLNSLAGNHILSGQFTENNGSSPPSPYGYASFPLIQNITGQYPAMLGCDAAQGTTVVNYCESYAIPYWNAGGLLIMNFWPNNPADNGSALWGSDQSVPAGGWGDVVQAGTTANTNFNAELNALAMMLQDYQNAGIILMYRSLIESNGNWFWFGTGSCCGGGGSGITAAQNIAIFQYMHDYLVKTKGLTNLAFIFSPNACRGGTCDSSLYPGAAYADIVGWDIYSDNPGNDSQGDYNTMSTYGKPMLYAEFGSNLGGNTGGGDVSFLESTLISQIQTYTPNVVGWQQWWSGNNPPAVGWGMELLTNTTDTKTAINNSVVINRGQIICSICGGGGGGGSTVVSWNPGDTSPSITLSNNNLTATGTGSAIGGTRATLSQSTGKVCYEVMASVVTVDESLGLANASEVLAGSFTPGRDNNAVAFYPSGGTPQSVFFNGVTLLSGTVAAAANGDYITLCADLGADLLWITTPETRAAGRTWNNSSTANPGTGTGGLSFSGLTCPCFPYFGTQDLTTTVTLNAAGPFAIATPSGFAAWQPPTACSYHPALFILGEKDDEPSAEDDNSWYIHNVSFGGDDGEPHGLAGKLGKISRWGRESQGNGCSGS